jgi:hypothetical protein
MERSAVLSEDPTSTPSSLQSQTSSSGPPDPSLHKYFYSWEKRQHGGGHWKCTTCHGGSSSGCAFRAYTAGLGVYIVEQHEVTLPLVIEILSAPRLEVWVTLDASSAMSVELVGNNVGGPAGDAAYEFSKLF